MQWFPVMQSNQALQPTLVPRTAEGWRYARQTMKLKFSAKSVGYQEALGGNIIQIVFNEDPDDDPLNPRSKNMCASINYDFPPCELLFDWADGPKLNGGLKAQNYTISDTVFLVLLEGDMSFEIAHSADSETIQKISALLLREVGSPENA